MSRLIAVRFRPAIILLLLLVPAASFASSPMDLKDYLALRRKCATDVVIEQVKARPSAYTGKTVEIRGSISGLLKGGGRSGGSVIVSSPHDTYIVGVDSFPVDNPGCEVACLVSVGKGCTQSLSDLQLVACTSLGPLRRAEEIATPPTSRHVVTPEVTRQSNVRTKTAAHGYLTVEDFVRAYRNAINYFNKNLSTSQADTIARSILGFSQRYQVDPRLVCAVILAESHFRTSATSRAGARGLGQLMPGTAARMGIDNAYDPVQNIHGSVRYIKGMLDRMSGNKQWNDLTWNDLALALASYNAGPGAVERHGGIPPYKETQNYVRRVTSVYKRLCGVN